MWRAMIPRIPSSLLVSGQPDAIKLRRKTIAPMISTSAIRPDLPILIYFIATTQRDTEVSFSSIHGFIRRRQISRLINAALQIAGTMNGDTMLISTEDALIHEVTHHFVHTLAR